MPRLRVRRWMFGGDELYFPLGDLEKFASTHLMREARGRLIYSLVSRPSEPGLRKCPRLRISPIHPIAQSGNETILFIIPSDCRLVSHNPSIDINIRDPKANTGLLLLYPSRSILLFFAWVINEGHSSIFDLVMPDKSLLCTIYLFLEAKSRLAAPNGTILANISACTFVIIITIAYTYLRHQRAPPSLVEGVRVRSSLSPSSIRDKTDESASALE
ncbi:hypothetical protein BS47DRAFT_1484605 [Hydnum rufescens UP504]|uniref:Uncharacterized protein n=1 Tax=Hydnum rufescens UP504 TaxID=1448309 RepID=A0A9P6DY27_9AGAM|nr:hypothetical protein BS47DRAFT_1484605 [Hydnum rufescens UP504]